MQYGRHARHSPEIRATWIAESKSAVSGRTSKRWRGRKRKGDAGGKGRGRGGAGGDTRLPYVNQYAPLMCVTMTLYETHVCLAHCSPLSLSLSLLLPLSHTVALQGCCVTQRPSVQAKSCASVTATERCKLSSFQTNGRYMGKMLVSLI